jgi:hypothetical protein
MRFKLTTQSSGNLKYKKLLSDFLAKRKWKDKIKVDSDKRLTIDTGIDLGEQTGRLIITADPKIEIVDVFIYLDLNLNLKCQPKKMEQMAILINEIHARHWQFGRFQVCSEGIIRWQFRVDFEGSSPSGLSIERIVGSGWECVSRFYNILISVALTKQTAKEALVEFDAD